MFLFSVATLHKKKKPRILIRGFFLLSNQDSNLDWLIQSQMCYHYTIGQAFSFSRKRLQKYYIFFIQQIFSCVFCPTVCLIVFDACC